MKFAKIIPTFVALLIVVTISFSANSFAQDEQKSKTMESVLIQLTDNILLKMELFEIKNESDQLSKELQKVVGLIMATELQKAKFQGIADTTDNTKLKVMLENGIKKVDESISELEKMQAEIEKKMSDLLKKAQGLVADAKK
jgi:F0F1-type ATP synthase membrane subunit b/b'